MQIRIAPLTGPEIVALLQEHLDDMRLHSPPGHRRHTLCHVMEEAAVRGYRRLSLETGSMAAFVPARTLYARFGFESCGPFAQYAEDPHSIFMTRAL